MRRNKRTQQAGSGTPRWTGERFRQLAPLVPASGAGFIPGENLVKILAYWDVYALGYLLLLGLIYRRRSLAELRQLVRSDRRRKFIDRVLTVAPEQLAPLAAATALVATVYVMPRADQMGTDPALVLVVGALAVITCWLMLHVSYAVVYLERFVHHGGLTFPGTNQPRMVDFLYFAVGIGTGQSGGDVKVTDRQLRRTVLFHMVFAFVFNTTILAGAVSIILG